MKKRDKGIIIIILLILLDQISKFLIVINFDVYDKLVIIENFFKFEYVKNTGISFGLFSGGGILIILLSLIVIKYLIFDLVQNNNKPHKFSCILILSGALGNLIDRIFRGYVVDFISFTLFNHEMAIFNIADILVVFGVILYIILMFVEGKNKDEEVISK